MHACVCMHLHGSIQTQKMKKMLQNGNFGPSQVTLQETMQDWQEIDFSTTNEFWYMQCKLTKKLASWCDFGSPEKLFEVGP